MEECKMAGQYAVIGLGRFGSILARELMQQGHEVLGIDSDETRVNEINDELTYAVASDPTDEVVLKQLGLRNFDCAIVAIGTDIQLSILTAILLKDLGVKTVVVRALSDLHGKVLEKIGVDRIIYPERDMAVRMAHQLTAPNLLDFIELSKDYTIAELSVPKQLSGRTLKNLDTRNKYSCSIIAIHKQSELVIAPTADQVLEENDVIVLIGRIEQIEQFEHDVFI
jgi:trk system potassium uptake protein TrkA